MILGKGYAYWNPETNALFEFDRNGIIINNGSSDKAPPDNNMPPFYYIMEMYALARRPALDSLGIEFLYENIQDEVLSNKNVMAFMKQNSASVEEGEENIISNENTMKNLQHMTPEQLKNAFPEAYNEAFQRGVQKEQVRVNSWLDSGLSIWQIRDGILKSNLTYQEALKQEMDSFWGQVDAKRQGTFKGSIGQSNNTGEQKEDYYSLMEAKEFYAQVDSMSKN